MAAARPKTPLPGRMHRKHCDASPEARVAVVATYFRHALLEDAASLETSWGPCNKNWMRNLLASITAQASPTS